MQSSFEAVYPNITLWVKDCGIAEIGYDFNSDSFIRAIDEGGMIWSGKSRYENLDAAFQDSEAGLGQIVVKRVLSVESSASRKHSEKRSKPKKTPARRRKGPPEVPLITQVSKLDAVVEAIRGKENVQVTRLTVVKKLCENPKAARAFALFFAQQARGRLNEKPGKERYVQLASRAVREMKSYVDDPTEDRKEGLWSLLMDIEAEQNEYESVRWGAVRKIKCWDLLIVEKSLRTILNRLEARYWLYQASRDYVGAPSSLRKERSHGSRRSPDSGDDTSRSRRETNPGFGRLPARSRRRTRHMLTFSDWFPQATVGLTFTIVGSLKLWGLNRGIVGGAGKPVVQRICGTYPNLANRHCIVRTGNPVSYHLIVHLKAKGTATLWPDKVAVLHAWSRRSPSLGFSPFWIGQSVGHVVALTVASRSPCRSHGLRQVGMLTLSLVRGCPVLYESQSAPPAIWRMR